MAVARIWRAIQSDIEQSLQTPALVPWVLSKIVSFREGSKAAEVCTLLCRPEGVTLREIMTATGWQAHTVRGFLSRSLRNHGHTVRSFERDGERVYRTQLENEPDWATASPE